MNQHLIKRIFKGYQQVDRLDKDPADSIPFCISTSNTMALCQVWPISAAQAMERNPKRLIQGIHQSLAPNQALIEVDCGRTASGKDFIYSIVKTLKEPHGVQYFVLLHYWETPTSVLNFQGFFDETGTTGIGDNMVFALLGEKHSFEEREKIWWFDPYDDKFEHKTLMNQSEKAELDQFFSEHPLSIARDFIKRIVNE